jgi:predicted chitinase
MKRKKKIPPAPIMTNEDVFDTVARVKLESMQLADKSVREADAAVAAMAARLFRARCEGRASDVEFIEQWLAERQEHARLMRRLQERVTVSADSLVGLFQDRYQLPLFPRHA